MNNLFPCDNTIGISEIIYLEGFCEYSKKRRDQMLLRLKRRNGYQAEKFGVASRKQIL